ncbi:TonB-dependent receptor [Actibacterium sp. MT2.3-13A]|uniref:TonB-dependent receptor plug domain-containing protein n=1 Tax=Actibacterium sp. MT2.3-13A TaxID=2828332 RepID=UPI001BA57158|nr:TonB-dependent receptor [Actibacterium sp. MT2.3-13A]
MNRAKLMATAAVAALTATSATAQETHDLGEIIVSGGLTPISAEAYGRAASVLTAEEIEERGITTVQDALRAVPGLSVSGIGANYTQVRIRGAESNHTLILIDGIEAAGGDGEYILSGLEAVNINRIEVLRGPQSVYYGSNASAGVVNIITRKGGIGTEYGGSVEIGGGTTATAFVSTRTARGGLSLNLSDRDDAGYDFSGDGGEKDGTDRQTLILSGDFAVTEALTLGFTLRRADERYEFDSTSWMAVDSDGYVVDDPTQSSTRDEATGSVYADFSMLEGRLTHHLAYEKTDNEETYGGFATKTESEALKYRLSFGLDGQPAARADQMLNLLVENEQDSSSLNPAYKRETTSVALEYRGHYDSGLDIQAGLRRDDNKVFKDITTWTVGAAYTFANGVRLHGSAGTGSVNPTYFELFTNVTYGTPPFATTYLGNPNLTPETNRSFDLGVELPVFGGRGLVDVTYFNETLTDEIVSVMSGPGSYSFANQTGDSDRQGVEVSAELAATEALDLRLSYTYLDATDPAGTVEIRRPKHELGLGATLETFGGRGTVTADLRHVAGNYDTQFWGAYQTVKLPDYTTVDVAARYSLSDHVTLTGRVQNLFDADVMDVWGYAGRGQTAYVGLDARW